MLVMYRLNLYENSVYPFVRFGDCTRNISAPILNILATILMATSSPVIIAGTKEFDASWLDIAMKGLPKFDHYRSTYLALDMGLCPPPRPGLSTRRSREFLILVKTAMALAASTSWPMPGK